MQNPNVLLAILSKMAQKPHMKYDKLFQKLYNRDLWLMAYEQIASKQGNMTPGTDGKTADGFGMELVDRLIDDLKASRYQPNPARRKYIEKANGKLRPLGIPCFEDKLLQTVVRLILEAIYEPTFSNASHGFRPERSCHTALEQVKKMVGTRWWVEGDIKGFFDNLDHETLLRILGKRITDNRFLHLIKQFLEAGYVEDWQYHKTYSGTPQGSNLSPLLSNIYLNELDQIAELKIAEFNKGKERRKHPQYASIHARKTTAKHKARITGDWSTYHALRKQLLDMEATDPQDPDYRRLTYVRYADDFLLGVIGSKADAIQLKQWLKEYLETELKLELSNEKTLITNAKDPVRFLGYDIQRWKGERRLKYRTSYGVVVRRTTSMQIKLIMPRDKVQAFLQDYGDINQWRGKHRVRLLHLSELEILHQFNAEIRGFLNYYSLADNYSKAAQQLLWMTTTSFLATLARKRNSNVKKIARSLKRGANRYVISLEKQNGEIRDYVLVSSTKYLPRKRVKYDSQVDSKPDLRRFYSRSELGQRILANQCEWCETREGKMEVHHVRKLKDLKGKALWEVRMIARQRKTMVLCKVCHDELHAGKLSEKKKAK